MITKDQASTEKPLQMKVGARMAVLRKESKLSQVEWAKELKIKQEKLSRIENGKVKVDSDVMTELIRMGISTDWLLTGEFPKHRGLEKNSLMTDVNLMREEIAVLRSIIKQAVAQVEDLNKKFYGQVNGLKK